MSFAVIFWVSSLVGTNGGERLAYSVAAALGILPRDTGFVSPTFLFVTNIAIGTTVRRVLAPPAIDRRAANVYMPANFRGF